MRDEAYFRRIFKEMGYDIDKKRELRGPDGYEFEVIAKLSGVEFIGTSRGGFRFGQRTYLPPATRSLAEAIELVKAHLGGDGQTSTYKESSAARYANKYPQVIREWARECGYQVAERGPIPAGIVKAFDATRNSEFRSVTLDG